MRDPIFCEGKDKCELRGGGGGGGRNAHVVVCDLGMY